MMASMKPFKFSYPVEISGNSLPRRVIVPKEFTMSWNDKTFIQLTKYPLWSTSLFGSRRCSSPAHEQGSGHRPLSQTDVFETITRLRNEAIDNIEMTTSARSKGYTSAQEAVDAGAILQTTTATGRALRSKAMINARSGSTSEVTIKTPTMFDIEGVEMQVAMACKHAKTAATWIEMTSSNLSYIRQVCLAQISAGDLKRKRVPKSEFSRRSKKLRKKISSEPEEGEGCQLVSDTSTPDKSDGLVNIFIGDHNGIDDSIDEKSELHDEYDGSVTAGCAEIDIDSLDLDLDDNDRSDDTPLSSMFSSVSTSCGKQVLPSDVDRGSASASSSKCGPPVKQATLNRFFKQK